jgi:dTMP kinase
MEHSKAKLIVFEGIDGCGKDTQLALVSTILVASDTNEDSIPFHITKEPTDGSIGKFIRNRYLYTKDLNISPSVVSKLFAADRLDHLTNPRNGISDYLKNGVNILCNRYYHSSFAYDLRTVGFDQTMNNNAEVIASFKPDLTIVIDIPPEVALSRINNRLNLKREPDATLDRYENISKLTEVREDYLAITERLIRDNNEHIVVVNGDRSIQDVCRDIIDHIYKLDLSVDIYGENDNEDN